MAHGNYDYGVVGNCIIAAIISDTASIDWLCMPEFDSASVFAKLLDEKKGGSFEIAVSEKYNISQKYLNNTNILETRFRSVEGSFDVLDFAPRYKQESDMVEYYCPPEIIRVLRYREGKPRLKIKFDPKLVYAKEKTETQIQDEYIKSFTTTGNYESIYLYSDLDSEDIISKREIELTESKFLALCYHQKIIPPTIDDIFLDYEKTKVYWMDWSNRTTSFPKYNNEIKRSALVLKLMAYQKSGAVLAALTTSLPETIGTSRTWDYRFCWIRDASMTIGVLSDLLHHNTVRRYISYILSLVSYKDEKMQIMYDIHGQKNLEEKVLKHLQGYLNSRPVRIGNAAYTQKQNDIYGILMDVLYKSLDFFSFKLDSLERIWTIVRMLVASVQRHWHEPDRGIWEFRGNEQHFVFSKVLCWVALDRGILIAEKLKKFNYAEDWKKTRGEIKQDVLQFGWNEKVGAFTQFYGSEALDSANLLIEDYGFIDAHDPKFVATVKKTYQELCVDGLMYRYRTEDDFGKPESAFTVCTFWMIECLFKIGKKKLAKEMFDKLLSYSNHLGLFAEDIDFKSKRQLGNFPQAYSHLALISAAELFANEREITDPYQLIKEFELAE